MRLNPYHPEWYWVNLGTVFYAAQSLRGRARGLPASHGPGYWVMARLAACYAQLGRIEEAKAAAAEVIRLKPSFAISMVLVSAGCATRRRTYSDGMRKAGLPDSVTDRSLATA